MKTKIPKIKIQKPNKIQFKEACSKLKISDYKLGEEVATRMAYGKALANLAKSSNLNIAVDAEVSNSTHAEELKKVKFKFKTN